MRSWSTTPRSRSCRCSILVAAYGPDKLNDPTQPEPILQQMIQMDPTDPANYFYLANIYEENGDYEQAEEQLLKAREMKPNDSAVYMTLAALLQPPGRVRQDDRGAERARAAGAEQPRGASRIATYYWDKAYKNFKLSEADKKKYVQAGLDAVDKALELKADYFEALTYKNLLLRLEGQPREESGEAAGSPEAGRPAPRQGAGTAEAEAGCRGRAVKGRVVGRLAGTEGPSFQKGRPFFFVAPAFRN